MKNKKVRLKLGRGYEQQDPGWYLYDEVTGKVWMTTLDEGGSCLPLKDEEIDHLRKVLHFEQQHEALKKDVGRLSGDMMNLPCRVNAEDDYHSRTMYKQGHRDARHAAAEKINEFVSALETKP